MVTLQYILLGFAPGLFWLWYFRRKDDLEPEPRTALLRVFGLGCLAAGAVLVLRPAFDSLLLPGEAGLRRDLADAFLVTAGVEEGVKLVAFILGAFLWRELDEPLDGVIYGIAAALGFASVENVIFLVRTGNPSLVVMRAFTATLGHVAFTGSMGFFFGLAKFSSRGRAAGLMITGLLTAIALHGVYDLFLLPGRTDLSLLSLLGLLPLALLLLGLSIRWSRARSGAYHPGREIAGT